MHDSYFVDCVRKYLKQGFPLKRALDLAIDECIEKDILRDILVKHRAEVKGMFLTTFDKKMYEEAMRMDGRKEEQENTERERQRANQAEERANQAEERANQAEERANRAEGKNLND